MQKLKFAKDEGSLFYKELNERINHYFSEGNILRTGNHIMYGKIGLYFSLDILFYALMLTSSNVITFYIFYLLMGLSVLLTAFNISHDAAHGVAVKSKFWNQVLFQLSFNLQGNNAYVWGKNHNESHHLYTNIEGSDIDVLHNPLFRMTTNQPLKSFHRFQWLYAPFLYLLYSLNWFFFREALMLFNYSSRTIKIEIPRPEIIKLVLYKIIYMAYMIGLPVYFLPFGWELVIGAFLLNHFMVSLLFVGVLGVSHLSDYVAHPVPDPGGKIPMSWPTLQLCTSVDYNPGSKFLNWTLGGFNAHALHHLLPNICHVHYLQILPIFRELAQKHQLVYMEMSYPQSLASHFRFLKGMGQQEHFKPIRFEDKHQHIAQDSALLKLIYAQVEQELRVNTKAFHSIIWLKLLLYLSATGLTYLGIYYFTHPGLFLLNFVGFGFASLLLAFNFSHDFSHNTIFKSKQLNNLGFTLIYTLVGAHAEAWKRRHINSHHYAPNVQEYDSDLQISSLIRIIPKSKYNWYHRFQHWYAPLAYTSYSLFWVFIKDFVILFSKTENTPKSPVKYHLTFWAQKLFYISYLIILPLLFAKLAWYVVLSGFLLMHLAQSVFLLFTFFMTHHVENTKYPTTDKTGYINTSWLRNQIESSNDMHPFSGLANFILGGFNNHIAHHIFPHIHHIYYPNLNKILYRVLQENGVTPNQTTYLGGIISHWRLLKQMSKE